MPSPRDPVKESRDAAPRMRLPVREGLMVIPPNLLTPGDSLVVNFKTGEVTIQRGNLVFGVIEPSTPI